MLLFHLVLIIVEETRCSRIVELQEQNVVEPYHAWTIKGSQFGDIHLAAALEGRFGGNCGQQPQWDVVEGSRVPEVCCSACVYTPGGHFERFLWSYVGGNSENTFQKAYVHILLFVLCCWFGRSFFFHCLQVKFTSIVKDFTFYKNYIIWNWTSK